MSRRRKPLILDVVLFLPLNPPLDRLFEALEALLLPRLLSLFLNLNPKQGSCSRGYLLLLLGNLWNTLVANVHKRRVYKHLAFSVPEVVVPEVVF